ncbi:MAG: hypothetical protein AB1641_21480 [Thermodesulfobacteriota bacterium]
MPGKWYERFRAFDEKDYQEICRLLDVSDLDDERRNRLDFIMRNYHATKPDPGAPKPKKMRAALGQVVKLCNKLIETINDMDDHSARLLIFNFDARDDNRELLNLMKEKTSDLHALLDAAERAIEELHPSSGRPRTGDSVRSIIVDLAQFYEDLMGKKPNAPYYDNHKAKYSGAFFKFVEFCLERSGASEDIYSNHSLGQFVKQTLT